MNSSAQDRKIAAESNKGHTILLLQFTPDDNSQYILQSNIKQTFLDYDDIYKCVDGLCQLYEQKLKVQNPGKQEVSYDVSELFTYLDTLKDLGCLVYNANIKGYEPKSRDWIKGQIYNHNKFYARFNYFFKIILVKSGIIQIYKQFTERPQGSSSLMRIQEIPQQTTREQQSNRIYWVFAEGQHLHADCSNSQFTKYFNKKNQQLSVFPSFLLLEISLSFTNDIIFVALEIIFEFSIF